jgi:hypothetical protein
MCPPVLQSVYWKHIARIDIMNSMQYGNYRLPERDRKLHEKTPNTSGEDVRETR